MNKQNGTSNDMKRVIARLRSWDGRKRDFEIFKQLIGNHKCQSNCGLYYPNLQMVK